MKLVLPVARLSVMSMTALAAFASVAAAPADSCTARSGSLTTPVVELYTSEGCNSCPPADRWLSKLASEPGIVALAFHVDYWDRLGWKDRFASAAYTERQYQQQTTNGARFSYTPQVVIDGADRPNWPGTRTPPKATAVAPVSVNLSRDGERFTAMVQALPGSPARLAAYWAVTEQNHVSAVKAGENEGVTLKHDFVVREYRPVAAWLAKTDAPSSLSFSPTIAADGSHARQVNLVVIDADTGRPVQAIKLGC